MSDITIYCPNCNTGFNVPQEAIGSEGRKVKCSQCESIWFQDPETIHGPLSEEPSDNDSPQDAPLDDNASYSSDYSGGSGDDFKYTGDEYDENSVPAELEDKPKTHRGLVVSFVCLLVLAGLSSVLTYRSSFPFLNPMYSAIGLQAIKNIEFSELEIYREREGNHLNFYISGFIKNASNSAQKLPPVKIKAMSKGGTVMKEIDFAPTDIFLKADEQFEIKAELKQISGNAEKVVIDLGSGLETILR